MLDGLYDEDGDEPGIGRGYGDLSRSTSGRMHASAVLKKCSEISVQSGHSGLLSDVIFLPTSATLPIKL